MIGKAGRGSTARPGASAARRRSRPASACASSQCTACCSRSCPSPDTAPMNGGSIMFSFGFGALLVIVILLVWAFRILREYERGVVFNLGRYWAVKGPGWFILIPVIQQMVKMDLRTVVLDVQPQDVITRGNGSGNASGVVYCRLIEPQKAVIRVADFLPATNLLAQTTLGVFLGK